MLTRAVAAIAALLAATVASSGCSSEGLLGRCTGSLGRVCHDFSGEISANNRAYAAALCGAAYVNTAVFEEDVACDPTGETGTCTTEVVESGSGELVLTVDSHFYDPSLTCASDVPF